jgi:hypothetical protein
MALRKREGSERREKTRLLPTANTTREKSDELGRVHVALGERVVRDLVHARKEGAIEASELSKRGERKVSQGYYNANMRLKTKGSEKDTP